MSNANPNRTIVIIESPYAGDITRNEIYLEACMRDSIMNYNEAPMASHKLYTGALHEAIPEERELGIDLGLKLQGVADTLVVYKDYGITDGMEKAIINATQIGLGVEYRKLPLGMLQAVHNNSVMVKDDKLQEKHEQRINIANDLFKQIVNQREYYVEGGWHKGEDLLNSKPWSLEDIEKHTIANRPLDISGSMVVLENGVVATKDTSDSIFLHYDGEYHQFDIDSEISYQHGKLEVHIKDPDEKLSTRLKSNYGDLLLGEGVEGLYNGGIINYDVYSVAVGNRGNKKYATLELRKPKC